MTLAELSKLSKGQFSGLLSSVTVGEVINAGHEHERSAVAASGPSAETPDDVNTRTAAGRREYDARVLEFIRESEDAVTATEIRNHVGGTSLQVRKAVARLIDEECVTWSGKARGTRYTAT